MKVRYDQAQELARQLGVPKTLDFGEFWKGIDVELEHANTIGKYVRKGADRYEVAASIALDHLKEDPHYYTKLAIIEKRSVNTDKGETI